MSIKHIAALAILVIGTAGCSNAPNTASMGMNESRCRAAGAEAVLGRQVSDRVLDEALLASGGLRTRVIPPGGMVTLDHDPMRLNIEVDENGKIWRMRCG